MYGHKFFKQLHKNQMLSIKNTNFFYPVKDKN